MLNIPPSAISCQTIILTLIAVCKLLMYVSSVAKISSMITRLFLYLSLMTSSDDFCFLSGGGGTKVSSEICCLGDGK